MFASILDISSYGGASARWLSDNLDREAIPSSASELVKSVVKRPCANKYRNFKNALSRRDILLFRVAKKTRVYCVKFLIYYEVKNIIRERERRAKKGRERYGVTSPHYSKIPVYGTYARSTVLNFIGASARRGTSDRVGGVNKTRG